MLIKNNTVNDIERIQLQLLKEGSEEAFENLFNRYSGKLYNFIHRLSSGNNFLTEEIVQRTFIKIWETHSFVNPEKSFVSYLCTIAKNMLFNEFEHQSVEFVYREYILQVCQEEEDTTEKNIDYQLFEDFVDKLTIQLPPARRRIFDMYRKEQLSVKEIAAKLQLAESTIQNQLSKAMQFMKENLTQYYHQIIVLILLNIR